MLFDTVKLVPWLYMKMCRAFMCNVLMRFLHKRPICDLTQKWTALWSTMSRSIGGCGNSALVSWHTRWQNTLTQTFNIQDNRTKFLCWNNFTDSDDWSFALCVDFGYFPVHWRSSRFKMTFLDSRIHIFHWFIIGCLATSEMTIKIRELFTCDLNRIFYLVIWIEYENTMAVT